MLGKKRLQFKAEKIPNLSNHVASSLQGTFPGLTFDRTLLSVAQQSESELRITQKPRTRLEAVNDTKQHKAEGRLTAGSPVLLR